MPDYDVRHRAAHPSSETPLDACDAGCKYRVLVLVQCYVRTGYVGDGLLAGPLYLWREQTLPCLHAYHIIIHLHPPWDDILNPIVTSIVASWLRLP